MDKNFIIELLDRRFSHRDFSILNRKWKLFHIEQVASEIMQIIDLECRSHNNVKDMTFDEFMSLRNNPNDKWKTAIKLEIPDLWDNDHVAYEYAVVHKGNILGIQSWGWAGEDKIILFDSDHTGVESNETEGRKQLDWMKKVTEAFCETLNERNL